MDMQKVAGLGSALASLMFIFSVVSKYFPFQHYIEHYFSSRMSKLFRAFDPYVRIVFTEYSGKHMKRSEAYAAIESYLSSSCSHHASNLKADFVKDSSILELSMDDHEEVTDDCLGVKMLWTSYSNLEANSSPFHHAPPERSRYYRLTFHKGQRELVTGTYMKHVVEKGKEVILRNRQRRLYTNSRGSDCYDFRKTCWNHVAFEHPANFDTLGMERSKKKEILDDLDAFRKRKEYYVRIGKAWKRGYLLHGPPGTGKSSMVAAIANHMDYDIYDLELTMVRTNTDLRRLLIETTSKSIILIEDIDCSLELTGKRKHCKGSKSDEQHDKDDDAKKSLQVPGGGEEKDDKSKVTLSGLLNFIDGLWSASAGERLIVFTTNHIEKLDPALIRRGRMDKHIEMSYCSFEAFKVLAKNYLGIECHRLFETVRGLMEEVDITPADVAENLMPKSLEDECEHAEACLESLVQALNEAKEKATNHASSEEEIVAKGPDRGTNVDDSIK